MRYINYFYFYKILLLKNEKNLKIIKSMNASYRFRNFTSNMLVRNMKMDKEIYIKKRKDEKYINFEFKIKHLLILDKNGYLLINSSISEYSKLSPKFLDMIKLLVMKIICLDLKYYEIFFKHYKIFILNQNFIYIAILSNKYNSCLIRLYLLFFNAVFINLLGDNIINQSYVDLTTISKIVEVYYIPPLTIKFSKAIDYILAKKETNSSKYLYKFKNLFIYYIENNGYIIPLFDYRKIIHSKELKYKYNIRKNEDILNSITRLILEPIYNNNYINKSEIYSHSLELYSTFPRWMLIGKYLKIYNGIIFVQLYTAKKLSKVNNIYQEYEIKEQMNIDSYYKIASKHSNKFVKIIEFFLYSYFETISDIMNKYCNPKNELLYFDIDLLIVTNDVLSLKVVEENLINLVYKRLKLNRKNEIVSNNSENNLKSSSDKESESNNNSEKNNDFDDKKDDSKIDDSSSSVSITSVSKTFLQLDTTDILKEIKRKSVQLSSFDSNFFYDGNSEFSEIWNISCIKNTNQNNYDLRSFFSNIPGEKKLSGIDKISIIEKQDKQDKLDISRRQTDKQINIFRGHRNSIGPTFNIIVNNNNNNTNNNNGIMANRKVSMKSLKNRRINSIVFTNKNTATITPNKMNFNRKKSSFNFNKAINLHKRSNSSTNSGLYLNQFYSMIYNNPKFFKSKYQILKEIQNKIKQSYTKKSNSLIIENKRENKKEKKVKIITNEKNNNFNKINSFFEDDQGITKDILQEFYEDKSSINFLQNNKNSLFRKLNKGK